MTRRLYRIYQSEAEVNAVGWSVGNVVSTGYPLLLYSIATFEAITDYLPIMSEPVLESVVECADGVKQSSLVETESMY